MQSSEPIIQLVGLGKEFRTSGGPIKALDDINLTICQGEVFGIIGLSGAGKSTLVRCINYLEVPTSGEVLFENRSLASMSRRDQRKARQSMGMIFQQFNLLMQRTAEENICFPLELAGVKKDAARERARELLELVNLSDRAQSYPSQLSGGQKQRVAIARALATNPKILLCDEATSALDPATTESILSLIKDINRRLGITAIIITHEMSVIEKICNQVAIISHGRIAETGSVEEVFFHPQTEEARQLVIPEALQDMPHSRLYRIIFNGRSSFEPVISNLVLECGAPVNIMFADTRDIGGTAFGQMVLQLPDNEEVVRRILAYADSKGLMLEEMKNV